MGAKSHWRVAAAVITVAAFFCVRAMWIPAKAELAQWLLERSWREVKSGADYAPPWPWADTQPVALLEVPAQDVRQLVLAGDSGRNLAFGPSLHGDLSGRDIVISGHRDTHFSFLAELTRGDVVRLETRDGFRDYEVRWFDIVDTDRQDLVLEPGVDRLSLVTCYPFDTLTPGGPLRYVVTATPVPKQLTGPASPPHAQPERHGITALAERLQAVLIGLDVNRPRRCGAYGRWSRRSLPS